MYEIGDLVIYGNQSVCRIEAIGTIDIGIMPKDKVFYTLAPVYGTGKTYTPINTEVFMRAIIGAEDAKRIAEMLAASDNDSDVDITECYKAGVISHDCEDLIQLINAVYIKEEAMKEQGKKLGQTDERYRKEAQELLYQELAAALDIPIDNIEAYIKGLKKEKAVQ